MQLLQHPISEVREVAARHSWRIGPTSIPALRELLEDESDDQVRSAALWSVAHVSPDEGLDAMRTLILRYTHSTSQQVRFNALSAAERLVPLTDAELIGVLNGIDRGDDFGMFNCAQLVDSATESMTSGLSDRLARCFASIVHDMTYSTDLRASALRALTRSTPQQLSDLVGQNCEAWIRLIEAPDEYLARQALCTLEGARDLPEEMLRAIRIQREGRLHSLKP
jgi:HEAT repeat protein